MTQACILSSVHNALDNRVYYREARSLRQAGYDVTLIAVHTQDEIRDGISIVALPSVPRWQRPRLWLTLLRRAMATEADVYHFHDPELLLVAPWLRLLTRKPTVYDIHEVYADFIEIKDYIPTGIRRPLAWVFRWLEPLLARLQSALIFADDEIAISFEGIRRPKATLFNYPERSFLESASAAIQGQGSPPREPIILYLGAIERNRGSELMLKAFCQILPQIPEARLLLVGKFVPPGLETEIRADAARYGIDHALEISGQVAFSRVGDYLSQAAVGWYPALPMPKYEKNIPTKLFEYMAYGLPIVSSALPATRPYVRQGENGYLAQPGDYEDHAQAILRLLSQPEAAVEMGRRGQELVDSVYNWDEMEQRLLELYRTLLAHQSPSLPGSRRR